MGLVLRVSFPRGVLPLGRPRHGAFRGLEAHLRVGAVTEGLIRGGATAAERHGLLGRVDVALIRLAMIKLMTRRLARS